MYGDYDKKNPVALQKFASHLQRLAHVIDPIDTSGESLDVDCKELASKPEQDTDSSPNHRGSGSGTTSNVNHNSAQSIPSVLSPSSSQLSTGTNLSSTITHSNGQSSSATSISQSGVRRQFFELCVDTYGSERATYLDEIDITKVQNDAELFHKIYESYKRLRGPRLRRLLLRPTHVHFVRVSESTCCSTTFDAYSLIVRCTKETPCMHSGIPFRNSSGVRSQSGTIPLLRMSA